MYSHCEKQVFLDATAFFWNVVVLLYFYESPYSAIEISRYWFRLFYTPVSNYWYAESIFMQFLLFYTISRWSIDYQYKKMISITNVLLMILLWFYKKARNYSRITQMEMKCEVHGTQIICYYIYTKFCNLNGLKLIFSFVLGYIGLYATQKLDIDINCCFKKKHGCLIQTIH